MTVTPMRHEVIWAIRNASGLDANEKAILWTVESRGIAYGTRDTMAENCGMTTKRFYGWRAKLVEKGLLAVTERPGTTTQYRVNAEALEGWSRIDHASETTTPPPDEAGGWSRIDHGGVVESTTGVESNRPLKEEPEDHPQEEPFTPPEEKESEDRLSMVFAQAEALRSA